MYNWHKLEIKLIIYNYSKTSSLLSLYQSFSIEGDSDKKTRTPLESSAERLQRGVLYLLELTIKPQK